MTDSLANKTPDDGTPHSGLSFPTTRRGWLLIAGMVFFASAGIVIAIWQARSQKPNEVPLGPLDGKLLVYVRPLSRGVQSRPFEEKGALPVRAGGIMSLEVQLNQPAFAYLIWLDSEGQVLPLYPWNTKELEIKDIDQPPPLRRAAKLIYSPLLGGGWTFGSQGGLETVLLVARRTPLPEATKLGPLLAPIPPPAKLRHPEELVVFGCDQSATTVSTLLAKNRGNETEAALADEALRELLLRLAPHFEFVRAVRFAHAE
jgi:hypothetical protein